jgi:Na+-translocating ferredoxin:NAD+ oxidoreductase RnfC subunit
MVPQKFEPPPGFIDLDAIEKMSPAERKEFWEKQFAQCLRCFACRNVCYGCYCKQCIFLAKDKRWLQKTGSPEENKMYHLLRTMHMAGRCIDCGECERVCPVRIPLRLLGEKLQQEIAGQFDLELPGMTAEEKPALQCFDPEDTDPFE